jgi:hypothetical protein
LIRGDWAGAAQIWARRGSLWTRAEALAYGDRDATVEALRIADGMGATRVAQRWRSDLRRRRQQPPELRISHFPQRCRIRRGHRVP